jgi:hypothetical protein
MGYIDTHKREICIDVKRMLEYAKEHDITFTDAFMHTMSHEYIHQIITDTESDYASGQFENICMRKYPEVKYWIGGVGGAKV